MMAMSSVLPSLLLLRMKRKTIELFVWEAVIVKQTIGRARVCQLWVVREATTTIYLPF
jgi:hypothetical protein